MLSNVKFNTNDEDIDFDGILAEIEDDNGFLMDLSDIDDEEEDLNEVVSINDGLIISLRNKGCVDVKYIASISNSTCKEVVDKLKGAIYRNPSNISMDNIDDYTGYEESSEYLSGNLYKKLNDVKEAMSRYKIDLSSNLSALESLLRQQLSNLDKKQIYITLGTPWVPAKYVKEFILYLFDVRYDCKEFGVMRNEYTGEWTFRNGNILNWMFNNTKKYGTPEYKALEIIKKTLNNQSVTVFDEFITMKNGKESVSRVINKDATLAALQKQNIIIEAFRKWIWIDNDRAEDLLYIYSNKYACIRKRIYNGSFIDLKDINPKYIPFDYQKNAIARIIFTRNTLLAHDVGAGKTLIMIASAMELRRMGISKKNVFVVPNSIVGEWKNAFLNLYPKANILVIDSDNFSKEKKLETMKKFRDEDYDGIIIAYSCFDAINLSYESKLEKLQKRVAYVESQMNHGRGNASLKKAANKLYREIESLMKSNKEEDHSHKNNSHNEIFFDELGVTRLYLDEAHNYKNVPIDSHISYVLGINKTGSKKCQDMYEKVKYVQNENDGGVIMATGTPITNSICDAYIFQKYLEEGELTMMNLENFDEWVQMFAERVSEFEIDVDTNSFRLATRFSRFHNVPELTSILSIISDFYNVDRTGLPKCDGYTDIVINKSKAFDSFLKHISKRADDVRNKIVPRTEDNLLKITTDGRKAALDLRIFNPKASYNEECKAKKCADEVSKIYFNNMDTKATQLVFCDTSTPKEGFNVYDELKRLLIENGVNEKEIAFVHDATTEDKRTKLFANVREGKVRVLIGSTFKLGIGVNIQDRLIAIHHLDIPWRPADMVQREGRMIRQGNNNDKVYIYRYITQGSFDAYSWQLLESKQKMIEELLSGTMYDSSINDVSDSVLSYAEVKALAIGNPKLKQRFETQNEITRLSVLSRQENEKLADLKQEETKDNKRIKEINKDIEKITKDIKVYKKNKTDYSRKENQPLRQRIRELFNYKYNLYLNMSPFEYQVDNTAFVYQGFDIVFPGKLETRKDFIELKDANFEDEESDNKQNKFERYIYLVNNGSYKVKLNKESGYLVKIDNVLEGLDKLCENLKYELRKYEERLNSLKKEYSSLNNYADKINDLKIKLENLDLELEGK